MRGLAFALVFGLSSWCLIAGAEPAVKNGETVRVSLAGRSQRAVGLRYTDAGWSLDVTGERTRADLIDMTPGTPARTLSVAIVGGTLKLDTVRFVGGHVYRAQLAGGARPTVMLVYLRPDPATAKVSSKKAGAERVRFDADEPAAASDDSGITRVEKGSL